MKKRSSRLLAAFLAAGMTLSMVACGNTEKPVQNSESTAKVESTETASDTESKVEEKLYYNETGYPICDEPITITVSGMQGNTNDWENTIFTKEVEENLGINLEYEMIANDAFATQYALMLSTNDIPDLIVNGRLSNTDRTQVNIDGEAGYWLDFSQYLDLMPNLVAMMEENPEWANYIKTETGAIYSFTMFTPGEVANSGGQIYYKKPELEAAGIDPDSIDTIEDFYNALVIVKEKYPDKQPLAITFDAMPAYNADIILRTAFGINYHDNSYMLVADDANKVSLADISDNNRAYLQWLNKLYDEGLLDANSINYTRDEYRTMEDKNGFVFFADTSPRFKYNETYNDQSDWGVLLSLSSEYTDGQKNYVVRNGVSTTSTIYASADTEYAEAICRFIDYLCTDEGRELAVYGVEGEHFEYIDDGYGNKMISQEKFADLKNYENVSQWWQQAVAPYQGFSIQWGFGNEFWDDVDVATLEKIVEDKNHTERWRASVALAIRDCDNVITQPASASYTSEEANERSTMYTDLANYLMTAKVSFISGEWDPNDDATWNKHVANVKSMGYDRLMEIEQAAWDRIVAASKN